MPPRPFGSTGLRFNPVGFGAMRIRPNDRGVSDALLQALEQGVDFIDTARNYGPSEQVVAQTLKQWNGQRPFVATKVKPRDITNWRFYVPIQDQFTPDSIRQSVETSLTTLGVDCLDLVQLHQWYHPWSDQPQWLGALHELRDQGKLRYIGVSAQDHEHDAVLKIVDEKKVDAVQIILNAFESRPLVSCVPLCQQRGVAVIARCVFDHSGSLATGGDRDTLAGDVKLAHASPELVTEYLRRIQRLRDELCNEAMDLNALSVRFALSHPGVSALALSLSSGPRVERGLAAAAQGPLPDDVFQRVCREHVWVKNFYYLSQSTVDGNPSK